MKDAKKPLIIGLTGSIAMGKSTAAQMFHDAGVPVFDADQAVHILQGPKGDYPNGAAVDAIEFAFPDTCNEQGVDRQKLSVKILENPDSMKTLEKILHPMVAQLRTDFIDHNATADMLVFDIPLLFEKGGEKNVDSIVVVSANAEIQRIRALARPNMNAEKLDHILSLQTPDKVKRS